MHCGKAQSFYFLALRTPHEKELCFWRDIRKYVQEKFCISGVGGNPLLSVHLRQVIRRWNWWRSGQFGKPRVTMTLKPNGPEFTHASPNSAAALEGEANMFFTYKTPGGLWNTNFYPLSIRSIRSPFPYYHHSLTVQYNRSTQESFTSNITGDCSIL